MIRILKISILILLLAASFSCDDKKKTINQPEFELADPIDPGSYGTLNQAAYKILFIGNSLTYFHEQPSMLYRLSSQLDKSLYIEQATIPGAQLYHHLSSEFTMDKISSQKWDAAILQEGLLNIAFTSEHNYIITDIDSMKSIILENNPDTKIYYFLPYSLKNGLSGGMTFLESQDLILKGTLKVAEKTDVMIAPVGQAWNNVILNRQDLELFASDGSHPSYKGAYLSACVYFAALFKQSAANNSFQGSLSKANAEYFQEIASETVLDSLPLWRIPADSILQNTAD